MSFDQLSSLESQPTTMRRQDDPQYSDDPEFQRLSQELMNRLFTLTGNISRLSNEIAHLGTKRDTERVRERVHELLEESKDAFKEVGEGVKKIQSWEDVSPSQKYTQQKLAREFQNNLQTFQDVQRRALEKQRTSATAARHALEEQQSPGEEGAGPFGQQQSQETLRLASQDEVDFQDSLIVEREAEIRNIEQGVTELNELFRDVAHIVNEQGEVLDTIANNVENTRSDTRGADLELRNAARSVPDEADIIKERRLSQQQVSAPERVQDRVVFWHPSPTKSTKITKIQDTSAQPPKMASVLDEKSLDQAFQGRADLQAAIRNAAALGTPPATGKDSVLLEIKDISLVIPQRKKYTLCFTSSHLYARLPTSPEPVAGISYAWKDIEYAFCLPVPEKTQKQYNYVFFPKTSNITPSKPSPNAPPIPEPLVFTIPDSAPKPGTISGGEASNAAAVSDDYKTLFDWAINARLKAAGRGSLKITHADPKLFASEQKQPHRSGEKAVFVKAFRGSKDGYLFFLPNGILWGFKKPLQFLPHERIAAVSYTSVLQRTFNLSVEVDTSSIGGEVEESQEEFEFSMLDQQDFDGISEYVKRHGLADKSMAEQRKAKRLNVNVVKDEDGNVVGNAEAGELEKAAAEAEQAAVDEEDEDEEDYDPGSEGESEGSETSSDEDDDGEGEGQVEDGDEEEDEEEEEL
ncbi:hypothetical protein G7Y89_g7901 [Cudoniella acicularis]|uniref:t-SNARE coiled-coil homology domain-containing protein n=1 Tax=Cudoniella acicularis TaxID=354080 RepID=A0A8H4W136_9HELO|nr:hypothetical protein G7Y89_g7901 [Cudoniella acicularis]